MGDDSVVALKTQVDKAAATEILQRLGFKAKMVVHCDPDFVEFCSGRFWRVSGGRVWGPKIGRALAKLGYAVSPQHSPDRWMKGVALGLKQDTNHVPLVSDMIQRILTLLKDVGSRPNVDEHKFHVTREHKSTDDTLNQLFKVYGINRAEYGTLRTDIQRVKRLPFLLDNPSWERFVDIDVKGEHLPGYTWAG